MEHVLKIRGLVHRYGDHTALAGVDLTVGAGECVALLGPNGAGKTTLVRNVIGLIEGEADLIEVAGGNPRRAETRRRLGVVQQAVGFPRSLTVGEIVGGAAVRRGCPPEAASRAIAEMGLTGLEKRRANKLSGGQQQRLQLAMGLVADPVLLVLDEPTEGLDVKARGRFWETIRRRLDDGAGVLITTHLVDEAAAVADRVVVVDRGRVVAEGTPDELRRTLPDRRVEVNTKVPASVIRALDSVHSVELHDGRTVIAATDSELVVRALLELDPEASDLTVATASLTEVLVAMTQDEEVAA
ncbi:MAG TPA: ABC transporter ATP-binding protein [Acidimicrobiia bacterium]|nr:ABC transporter ATP-binding protein [Acidimicrobiia bacterium]